MTFGRRVAENYFIPPIFQGRQAVTAVGMAGQEFEIVGLPEAGYLSQVVVDPQGGTGTKFTVEVFKGNTAIALNKIFEYADWLVADGTLRVMLGPLPYANVDDEQKLYVKITPDAGADNDYDTELVCAVEP